MEDDSKVGVAVGDVSLTATPTNLVWVEESHWVPEERTDHTIYLRSLTSYKFLFDIISITTVGNLFLKFYAVITHY